MNQLWDVETKHITTSHQLVFVLPHDAEQIDLKLATQKLPASLLLSPFPLLLTCPAACPTKPQRAQEEALAK
jgi:hypothetical protein